MRTPGRVLAAWPGLLLAVLAGCAVHGPVLGPLAAAGRPERVDLDSTPFFPQSQYQCGPAALATVLAAAGASVTADELVPEVYLPGRQGSLQPELVAATRQRDLVPYLLPPEPGALLDTVAAGRPVLVLQKLGAGPVPGWHYAVVVGYDVAGEVFLLRSGTERRQVMKARHFLATWDRAERWALAPLPPGELPPGADATRYLEAVAGLEAVGRTAAADTAYEAAAGRWPDAALPRLALANRAYARGDLVAAERGYREAARLDPAAAAPHNNRAEVLRQLGCPAAARREIEIARPLATGGPLAAAVEATAASIPVTAGPDAPGCPVP
jgi:hypothetical protein